jgi:hypothetical protein
MAAPNIMKIEFDNARARGYRKRVEVLAFQCKDPMLFMKSWGKQTLRDGSWVIVPVGEDGAATDDVYGCDPEVFTATYERSPSLRPNRYRKKETIRAYQPGTVFEVDTVLPDGHVEVRGSSIDSYDAWVVRGPRGEVYPIEDAEFRRTYVEITERPASYRKRTRDEHWSADGTPKRVLALDGGGVRGILTVGYLERVEEILRGRHGGSAGFRLSHYFDLIAGTSTGAIIAACLAKGMAVSDVRDLYQKLAGSIFKRSPFRWGILRARYGANQLREYLKDVFKNNTMGSQAIETGLLVVAKRLDTGSTWPMSNNPRNRFFTARGDDTFLSNEDYPVQAVVRASTAAPSFFAPEYIEISPDRDRPRGEFVDGGVSPHNNPALMALQYVALRGFGAGWALDSDKLLLVSVGTGNAQPGVSHSWLAGPHAVNSLLALRDDCAEQVETLLQWLSRSPTARRIDAGIGDMASDLLAERPLLQYLRYNVSLERSWIYEQLGMDLPESEVRHLRDMDRPEMMPTLHLLGVTAAKKQILESHFPPSFDLGG